MNAKNCIIIFSGFNQRAIIAFIRTLEINLVEYAIIAKSKDDLIFNTVYKDKVVAIRQSITLVLSDIIHSINSVKTRKSARKYIIAPSAEALNRFLLKNRKIIESKSVVIPLVSKNIYESISDKYSFGKLCENNGIKVPQEYNKLDMAKLPFVAKPRQYFASDNFIHSPYLILNNDNKQSFLERCNSSDFFYQEFINGKSFYLLYYFHRDGMIFKFSQENIIQQPNGKSIVAAISSDFHQKEESLKYEKLFQNLNFFGLVMVEVKQQGDEFYMIEANPRFWGPSQLMIDAGMNFFEAFLHDFTTIKTLPNYTIPLESYKYFWFGGVMEVFKQNKKLTFHKGNNVELIENLHSWLKSDIYKRKDTTDIFKIEII